MYNTVVTCLERTRVSLHVNPIRIGSCSHLFPSSQLQYKSNIHSMYIYSYVTPRTGSRCERDPVITCESFCIFLYNLCSCEQYPYKSYESLSISYDYKSISRPALVSLSSLLSSFLVEYNSSNTFHSSNTSIGPGKCPVTHRTRYVPRSRSYIIMLSFILNLGPIPTHKETCKYAVARFPSLISSSCKHHDRHSMFNRFTTYSLAKSTFIEAKPTHSIYPYNGQYHLSGKILQLKLYTSTLVLNVNLP